MRLLGNVGPKSNYTHKALSQERVYFGINNLSSITFMLYTRAFVVITRLEFVLSHTLHLHRKHKVVSSSPTGKSFFSTFLVFLLIYLLITIPLAYTRFMRLGMNGEKYVEVIQ